MPSDDHLPKPKKPRAKKRTRAEIIAARGAKKPRGAPKLPSISPQELQFLETYLSNGEKITDAYRKVFGSTESAVVQHQRAQNLFKSVGIQRRLALAEGWKKRRTNEILERYVVSQTRLTEELASIAFSNIGDYIIPGEDGKLAFDLNNLTPRQMAALSEVSVRELSGGQRVTVKMHNKLDAVEKLLVMSGWKAPEGDDERNTINLLAVVMKSMEAAALPNATHPVQIEGKVVEAVRSDDEDGQ